jgi:hypothetical protein
MTPVVARAFAQDLQDRLDAAMQIIAALVLTEEEVRSMAEHTPSYSWTETMKRELLEDRAELVEVLKTQGFLCNTSTQYVLNPLKNHLGNSYILEKVTADLNQWAEDSVRAKEILPLPKGGPDYMEAQNRLMLLDGISLHHQVKWKILFNA